MNDVLGIRIEEDPVDAAWVGLAGVVVGVAGTLGATWLSAWASTQQAREQRQAARLDSVRERAVEGYIAAVEAVSWLSSMHVEDSVDPQFEAEYGPKTADAMGRLEEARSSLGRVAGLGGSKVLAGVAQETYGALTVLGDAWTNSQKYQFLVLSGAGESSKTAFDRHYKRLNSAREQLCGMAGDLPYREIDQGQVLEGSLLYRLREATSSI